MLVYSIYIVSVYSEVSVLRLMRFKSDTEAAAAAAFIAAKRKEKRTAKATTIAVVIRFSYTLGFTESDGV